MYHVHFYLFAGVEMGAWGSLRAGQGGAKRRETITYKPDRSDGIVSGAGRQKK